MWNRQELKYNAKQELKISYWPSLGVALVASFISGGLSGGSSASTASSTASSMGGGYGYVDMSWVIGILVMMAGLLFIAFIFGWLYSAFLGNVIEVGKCAYFIRAPYGDRRFNYLFYPFKNGRYMSVVKAQFKTQIIIFAWSLLFVIPGIVKSYQYRFVPYLLAENPHLSADECMALSRQMTDGQKMEMFVLDLSFLGWYLLGTLACGIGIIFVMPYEEATRAQLYFALRPRVEVPPAQDGFFAPADIPMQYSAPQYQQPQQPVYPQYPQYPQTPGQGAAPGQPTEPAPPPAGSPYAPNTPSPAGPEDGKEE